MPLQKQERAALHRPTKPFLIPAISTAGTNARFARCRLKIENNARLRGPTRPVRDCVDRWRPAIRSWFPEKHFQCRDIQGARRDRWRHFAGPLARFPRQPRTLPRAIFREPRSSSDRSRCATVRDRYLLPVSGRSTRLSPVLRAPSELRPLLCRYRRPAMCTPPSHEFPTK